MNYEIKTDRLILRPLSTDDLETVHAYASDEENTAYMFWLPNHTIEETRQFLIRVSSEWQKGIASEAAFAIKDFAINTLHLKKLIANCDYRNAASYTLMNKIGLKLEKDDGVRTYPKKHETVKQLTYSMETGDIG